MRDEMDNMETWAVQHAVHQFQKDLSSDLRLDQGHLPKK